MRFSHKLILAIFAYCFCFVWICEAFGRSAQELLAELQAVDSVYGAGFSARGSAEVSVWGAGPTGLLPRQHDVTWVFTSRSEQHGILWEAIANEEGIRIKDPVTGANKRVVFKNVLTRFDGETAVNLLTNGVLLEGPDRQWTLDSEQVARSVASSQSGTLHLPVVCARWASGRGLSEYLDSLEIVSVPDDQPADSSTTIVCEGLGMDFGKKRGRWSLWIDADSLLVEQATFTAEGQPKPSIELNLDGIKNNGSCVFPESGTVVLNLLSVPVRFHYVFSDAELNFSEDIWREISSIVDAESHTGDVVIDNRTRPPTVSRHGLRKVTSTADLSNSLATSGGRSWSLLIINALFCFALFGLLCYRRWKQGGSASGALHS